MRSIFAAALTPATLLALTSIANCQSGPLAQGISAPQLPVPVGIKWGQQHSQLFYNANIGSFKILGNETTPAEGQLDMTFNGTVLISDMDPASKLVITGSVRKEIDDVKDHKVVYHGSGRLTFIGKVRGIQFFGRDLRASYNGFGVVRMVGEFDKNLDTGLWWYAGDTEKQFWATSLITIPLPKSQVVPPKITGVDGKG